MKRYGDEDLIFLMKLKAEEEEQREGSGNTIEDGWIWLNEERTPFVRQNLPIPGLSMILPEAFDEMPEELAMFKYPSGNRPSHIFSNQETTVSLTLTLKKDRLPEEKVEEAADSIRFLLGRLQPSAKFLGTERIEGKRIVFETFDFVTQAIDTDIYNRMFLASLRSRMLLGSLNCTGELSKEWEAVFRQMLASAILL